METHEDREPRRPSPLGGFNSHHLDRTEAEMDHVHWRWLMGQIDRVNSSISYINIKKLSERVRSLLTGEVRNENSNHNGSNARVGGAHVRISARLDNKGPAGQDSVVRLHERGYDHQARRYR